MSPDSTLIPRLHPSQDRLLWEHSSFYFGVTPCNDVVLRHGYEQKQDASSVVYGVRNVTKFALAAGGAVDRILTASTPPTPEPSLRHIPATHSASLKAAPYQPQTWSYVGLVSPLNSQRISLSPLKTGCCTISTMHLPPYSYGLTPTQSIRILHIYVLCKILLSGLEAHSLRTPPRTLRGRFRTCVPGP